MLQVFSELNGTAEKFHDADVEGHFRRSDHLKDVQFWPDNWPTTLSKLANKTFENVSLSKTRFYRVTFKNCTFMDCLFVGTEFTEVEFHRCTFTNCNFFKTSFEKCYIDPSSIKIAGSYRKTHANIFVTLFQRLLDNSRAQHQAAFAEVADIRFRQWKRAQLSFERREGHITSGQYRWRVFWSWVYELTCGFGYRPWRFYAWTVGVFLFVSFLNWVFLSQSLVVAGTNSAPRTLPDAIYFTFSILTILGFSTIVPQTDVAKLVTVLQALAAVGWLSILTALLVKRFLR